MLVRQCLEKHVMIPYAFDKNNANIVHVAMADPMDMVALDDFSIVTNLQAEPAGSDRQRHTFDRLTNIMVIQRP